MSAIQTKPLSFFHPDETQPRQSFDLEELRLLRDSLVKKQLVPLICRPTGLIIDGHRRWQAALLDGKPTQLDTIIIEEELTEAQVKVMQLVTALHRADLTPFEVYAGCQEWRKHHPGATAKELAAAIDRTEAHVSKLLALDRCIPPVREAAASGKLGLSDWVAIAKVPEADQAALLAAKLAGASRDELERKGRQARHGGTPAVRVSRVKCSLPSGVSVTFAGQGAGLTLDDIIETLSELLKEAKKANERGLDSKTFAAVMRDMSKVAS